ncbi:MAG: hypothetical protein VB021_01495 [Oscillospiraceae bacterium]|nr:hypothetical protein [Oscillospiraceae bacterium]
MQPKHLPTRTAPADEETINRIIAQDRTLGEKIRDFFSDLAIRFKGTEYEKELLNIRNMYEKALREAKTSTGAGRVQNSINPSFGTGFGTWMKAKTEEQRIKDGGGFLVGRTSDALRSIDADDYNIYFGKSKIAQLMRKHTLITEGIVKEIPNILEAPLIVMQSQTVPNNIVLFGDSLAGNNSVMISILLKPTSKTGEVLGFGIITSAYDRTVANAQGLIDTSDILYVANEKTDSRLKALGLQLPSAITNYGSVATITYYAPNDKNDTSEKAEMQKKLEAAGLVDESGKGTLQNSVNTDVSGRAVTPQQDKDYMAAAESGDAETQQRYAGKDKRKDVGIQSLMNAGMPEAQAYYFYKNVLKADAAGGTETENKKKAGLAWASAKSSGSSTGKLTRRMEPKRRRYRLSCPQA